MLHQTALHPGQERHGGSVALPPYSSHGFDSQVERSEDFCVKCACWFHGRAGESIKTWDKMEHLVTVFHKQHFTSF